MEKVKSECERIVKFLEMFQQHKSHRSYILPSVSVYKGYYNKKDPFRILR